ncbi:MAG: hypothetical protein ACYC6C_11880 [Coriobacteriia bacterium]
MSIPQRLDHQTVDELRVILSKMNVVKNKVIIDLDNETIEIVDDYSIDDILESAGVLTPEQGRRLAEEVRTMREDDWN